MISALARSQKQRLSFALWIRPQNTDVEAPSSVNMRDWMTLVMAR